jgi:hypothetical protein
VGVVSRGRKGDIREFGWQSRSEPGLGFVDQAWCIPRPGNQLRVRFGGSTAFVPLLTDSQ